MGRNERRGETRKPERSASNIELIGGELCLDFANTLSTRMEGLGREYFTSYCDLVAWSRHAGVLNEEGARTLLQKAAHQPDQAAAALERAIALRETLYHVFSAIADNRQPQEADLTAMNCALHEALSRLEVVPAADGFAWNWVADEAGLDHVLWPVVRSAAQLLTSGDLARVSECAREGCDWLFVDTSKNHSRRWCTMAVCGSRVKARRYYRRKKISAT
jgi:predicted RNA-binding Zn ribbon-like protein